MNFSNTALLTLLQIFGLWNNRHKEDLVISHCQIWHQIRADLHGSWFQRLSVLSYVLAFFKNCFCYHVHSRSKDKLPCVMYVDPCAKPTLLPVCPCPPTGRAAQNSSRRLVGSQNRQMWRGICFKVWLKKKGFSGWVIRTKMPFTLTSCFHSDTFWPLKLFHKRRHWWKFSHGDLGHEVNRVICMWNK